MAQEQESRGGAWRALRQKWTGRTAEKGGADAEEPACPRGSSGAV